MVRQMFFFASLFFFGSFAVRAETYTIGGSRPALLLTPNRARAPKKVPLLIFLHGYTSNANQSDGFFGISRQRDALGFAIALPDGTKNSRGDRFWNATPECCDFEQSGVDDAAYIAGLIREASGIAPIDPGRVYLIGHSNGGFMSYRMACEYPELLRGIVVLSGAFFKNAELCKRPAALNILHIHGSLDDVVPIAGHDTFPATQSSLDYWTQRGGCGGPEHSAFDLDVIPGLDTDAVLWNQCEGSTQLGFWTMLGTGHLPYFNEGWLARALKFVE